MPVGLFSFSWFVEQSGASGFVCPQASSQVTWSRRVVLNSVVSSLLVTGFQLWVQTETRSVLLLTAPSLLCPEGTDSSRQFPLGPGVWAEMLVSPGLSGLFTVLKVQLSPPWDLHTVNCGTDSVLGAGRKWISYLLKVSLSLSEDAYFLRHVF